MAILEHCTDNVVALHIQKVANDFVELSDKGKNHRHDSNYSKNELWFEAGQFFRVAVVSCGSVQFHPITISSSPFEWEDAQCISPLNKQIKPNHDVDIINSINLDKFMTLHIKAMGSWSQDLIRKCQHNNNITTCDLNGEALKPSAKEHSCVVKPETKTNTQNHERILLEGPFGNLSIDINNDDRYRMVVFITGGIGVGVTPCRSIARQLLYDHAYNGRKLNSIRFVWSVRDLELVKALPLTIPAPPTKPVSLRSTNPQEYRNNGNSHLDDEDVLSQGTASITSSSSHPSSDTSSTSMDQTNSSLHSYCKTPSCTAGTVSLPMEDLSTTISYHVTENTRQNSIVVPDYVYDNDNNSDHNNTSHTENVSNRIDKNALLQTDIFVTTATNAPTDIESNGAVEKIAKNRVNVNLQQDKEENNAALYPPNYHPNYHKGRPNINELLMQVKLDALERRVYNVAIVCCGPVAMIDQVRTVCRRVNPTLFQRQSQRQHVIFNFHEEVFEY
eukprot:CAMPEP_0194400956 /NCGR_PEP_ID=MMETSP0174-20130528/127529_1 /TAXON_ID=216777 /ORGANISM="Proboscia alata, Strain PI-D3" /LENGTH=502 /DNA_ID=CAMNT_0039197585 /DNA_START=162 /DNA_END=1667 /DNA_ORIENTATION=-